MKRLTADQVRAGFIGLGNMGSRIARRLLDHGYRLSLYDADLAKAEAIAAHGGVVATSIVELARTVDVVAEGRPSFEAETVLETLTGTRLTVLLTTTFPMAPGRFDSVLVTVVVRRRLQPKHTDVRPFRVLAETWSPAPRACHRIPRKRANDPSWHPSEREEEP
jgi:NAD binding domain of 6-phosphogluconate dehydrogenase